jgi:hypothetical protein
LNTLQKREQKRVAKCKKQFQVILNILSIFIVIFLIPTAQADLFIFELGAGTSLVTYSEVHELRSSKDVDITAYTGNFTLGLRFFIIPNFISFDEEFTYTAPTITTSDENLEVGFLYNRVGLNLHIPARPFDLILANDYFYDSIETTTGDYGYSAQSAAQLSVIASYTTKSGTTNFQLKYPYFSGIKNREYYELFMRFNMSPKGSARYFDFVPGWKFNFKYTSLKLDFPGTTAIQIKARTLSLNLSRAW